MDGSSPTTATSVRAPNSSTSPTYTVPATGTVDLASASPQLASFHRPDSAALFWSLRGPELPPAELARQWMRETNAVTLTASDGDRLVAERTFELQGLAAELTPHSIYTRDLLGGSFGTRLPHETHEDQRIGRFFDASSIERPVAPAVLMFDDPETGASSAFTAPLLSAFGASVFVLPVASPDGVHVSSVIDSTTVESVLHWLGGRPDVDSRHIFVYGTGAAEQLALWAAARFPDWLHGVFAGGGSRLSRVRWLTCVRAAAEEFGIGWVHWSLGGGFGVVDGAGRLDTSVVKALVPGA